MSRIDKKFEIWYKDIRSTIDGQLTDEIINQEKPNVGAALVEAFAYIGGSVLITWAL